MSTIQERAEAASRDLFKTYGAYGVLPSSKHFAEVAAIIARRFASLEPLRAAAERAEKERNLAFAYIKQIWANDQLPGPLGDALFDALIADRRSPGSLVIAALTPDAAADGTKGDPR